MTKRFLLPLLGIVLLIVFVETGFDFTNIVCEGLDKSFLDFEYCFIKAVNRSYNYISLKANLYGGPVSNATIRIALLKRANGYKPFLYNISFDACKFLKTRKRNKIVNYFYVLFGEKYTNINHTCPYDNYIIVEKLSSVHFNSMLTDILPMPRGDYAIRTEWRVYNKLRAIVTGYGKLY